MRVEIKPEPGDSLEHVIFLAHAVALNSGEHVWFSFNETEIHVEPGDLLCQIGYRFNDAAAKRS